MSLTSEGYNPSYPDEFQRILTLETFYSDGKKDIIPASMVRFRQGKNAYYYDLLEKELKNPDSKEVKDANARLITIDGIQVISYVYKNGTDVTDQLYMWKQGGILNQVRFPKELLAYEQDALNEVEDHEEIVKALMK
ncbi:hypothetical protein Curi_c27950 [Gottschalkia acidurici 9a]|uniref:Uncharacterized protein n=1 Tax=Gottschalkia acidurici (strain ATCC 7906 / DSM 604 / BCRC 14475 / CIP 104303 / KCTC 5404 / NCIMB 10678 / 9a) TaxID=1128398 RepID=K0B196_GOTA9|nr:hypothetical protein [Gottschalkia acidurici]AFS79788.1 hypothetical protein Curi_c27950 [Gottschalkia acidurici 9a]